MLRRNTRTYESKEEEDGNDCGEGERWNRDEGERRVEHTSRDVLPVW